VQRYGERWKAVFKLEVEREKADVAKIVPSYHDQG
jgi:hypothetical protein